MGVIKKYLIELEDDYERTKHMRTFTADMQKLLTFSENTTIKTVAKGIHYVDGDTTNMEFWRIVRNHLIEDCSCNDDWQWDEVCYNFQKELIGHGVLGKVKLALIGSMDNDKELERHGNLAISNGYVPIYWCWCHDHWSVNEKVLENFELQIKGEQMPFNSFIIPTC